jgi:hypothetical protein
VARLDPAISALREQRSDQLTDIPGNRPPGLHHEPFRQCVRRYDYSTQSAGRFTLSRRELPTEAGKTSSLAAASFGFREQHFRFAQKAVCFGISRPARILHQFTEMLKLGLGFSVVAELLLRHGDEGDVSKSR